MTPLIVDPFVHASAAPDDGASSSTPQSAGEGESRLVQSTFLASVSHELRTPLAGIIGMIGLLEKSDLNGEQREYLGLLRYSTKTLAQLVNDLLEYSRAEKGGYRLARELFSPAVVVERAVSLLAAEAAEKRLALSLQMEAPRALLVLGDPVRLQQVVSNLVMNAIKYTERGSIRVGGRIIASRGGSVTVEISVADTGIGIPSDKFASIFDSFTQLEAPSGETHRGLGLGLAIVRELVGAMGGTVSVESTVGVGSLFAVRLPLCLRSAPAAGCDGGGDDARSSSPGGLILVAEDEAINRLYLKTLLSRLGYVTRDATTGLEVLSLLSREHCDLILMDVGMPLLDGVETARRIRRQELDRGGHVPIIALTAHAQREDVRRCLSAGVDDYLTKPFAEGELLAKISGALRAARR